MPKLQTSTPNLNRLRGAAGLIPLIEDGLQTSKIPPDKAFMMAAFCSWALLGVDQHSPETDKLTADIQHGLDRIRTHLSQAESEPA
ncbi:MAG: hypothetical protein EKK46_13695 [Rhodocyclaceae bacterium]|nr:MAG: hypothetical protein EKK46_13695 [Rhodocyclaceae bacterium]